MKKPRFALNRGFLVLFINYCSLFTVHCSLPPLSYTRNPCWNT